LIVRLCTAVLSAVLPAVGFAAEPRTDADIAALTAVDLAAELADGRLAAERVTRVFLARIAELDDSGPNLNAVIELAPDAVATARALDERRARSGPVGPLHVVPVLLKASIDTADALATSAGSLALADHHADRDAPVVARLRAAGAVIIGKANLSEWANFRSTRSTSGWSSLGGQTRNPYVLDRTPCGSSSGSAVAVAARLVPLAIGTETDGSIVCPAAVNGVVGMKPTLGLVSARGIVPIAKSQDTPGPFARTVADAGLLLRAMEEPPASPGDLATAAPAGAAAGRIGMAGERIGVLRSWGGPSRDRALDASFMSWLELLRATGAELVDPVTVVPDSGVESAELEVLLHEFRVQIDEYLRGVRSGPRSLDELMAFNSAHAADVMPFFGQELFVAAQKTQGLDDPSYLEAIATIGEFRARLAEAFASQRLAAIVAPVTSRAWVVDMAAGDRIEIGSSTIAAVTGYPSVAVPAALIDELPVAIAFIGKPGDDRHLLAIAAAFEAARGGFPAPRFLPSAAD
jgi:amidase